MRALTILALLLSTSGCAKPIIVNAFDGPDRPSTEVATLDLDFRARLVHLDGQAVPGLPAGLDVDDPGNPRILRLLPGQHEMLVGLRPYTQTNSTPIYGLVSSGDCRNGGSQMGIVGYQTTTTSQPGSREDEHLQFTVAPGRRYRLLLDDPPDWFSRRERWSARVVEKADAWKHPIVSASLGRRPHPEPSQSADGIEGFIGAAAMKTALSPLSSRR